MCFDNGICDGSRPLNDAGGKDGQSSITGDVPQSIRKVTFPLAAKACDPMCGNVVQDCWRQRDPLQEFQPVELAVDIGRVLAHLELSQPDEAADPAISVFIEQTVKFGFHFEVETCRNASLDPLFGRNQCVSTVSFYDRQAGQDNLSPAAFLHKPANQTLTRLSRLGVLVQPPLHFLGMFASKHLVTVHLTQ